MMGLVGLRGFLAGLPYGFGRGPLPSRPRRPVANPPNPPNPPEDVDELNRHRRLHSDVETILGQEAR
jgi:hypothetical protein